MYNPSVNLHKTVLMQRLLDAVSHGYYWHTSGTVPLDKAQRLADKFSDLYGVDMNDNQRAYAKRMGRANARLFLLFSPNNTDLHWWLLASDGTGDVHTQERLMNAHDSHERIRTGYDYELIRRTRASKKGGGTVWSWRMTHECYSNWRERIISVCRKTDGMPVKQAVTSLYRAPGFSGVREQVGKLMALTRAEWRRHHGDLSGLLQPAILPYIERLPDTAVSLSTLYED